MSLRARWIAALSLAGGLALAALLLLREPPPSEPLAPVDPAAWPSGPTRALAEALAVPAIGQELSPRPDARAYVALRQAGLKLSDGWATGSDWRDAALRAVRDQAGKLGGRVADVVELCLPYDVRSVGLRKGKGALGNVHRGIRGLMLRVGKRERWACPTEMVATNRSFERVQELFQEDLGLSEDEVIDRATASQFEAHQLLISLGRDKAPAARAKRMVRGNTVVAPSAVTEATTQALADGMAEWLINQVQADGRMTYLYWPSRGAEALERNNMIRQFMATLALVRVANYRNDNDLHLLALRNQRYNFSHFYRPIGPMGGITYRGKTKLGAAALAALGVIESPSRARLEVYEVPLRRLVEKMQHPDGSFATFFGSNREDNQNFYPGEALLMWASVLERLPKDKPDPELLDRFMRAFLYYRSWHRGHVNPAFIPWHTQAYCKVWRLTKNHELADFVFEMNDFLADFQEWENSRYPDTKGRFYDDDRRQLGPPHASATGVYLEGLIDAYELALALKDSERAERYRRSILRGLRSLMRLQYQDDVDTFYISKREAVLGGIRTTVYDNAIRIDNVQHSLMALLKILPTFRKTGAFDKGGIE